MDESIGLCEKAERDQRGRIMGTHNLLRDTRPGRKSGGIRDDSRSESWPRLADHSPGQPDGTPHATPRSPSIAELSASGTSTRASAGVMSRSAPQPCRPAADRTRRGFSDYRRNPRCSCGRRSLGEASKRRRNPKQRRANITVDAIVWAALEILDRDGTADYFMVISAP
jgi:hypothetical protein